MADLRLPEAIHAILRGRRLRTLTSIKGIVPARRTCAV